MANPYHEANRKSWNAATERHQSHRPDLAELMKSGHNNIYAEDMALLGDIKGKTLVHLQCNNGLDTLSIANHLGADVTGVDISDYAVEVARKLAEGSQIPAKFVRSDIFDWFDSTPERYDVVYTSYGAINWISDVARWAKGIAHVLNPGGKFVMVEFHPARNMLELDFRVAYDYMGGTPEATGGVGDYVGNDYEGAFVNPNPAYEFSYGLSDIYNALVDAGLTITHFKEYPYINGWQPWPNMRHIGSGRYIQPEGIPNIAMMFSFAAVKKL